MTHKVLPWMVVVLLLPACSPQKPSSAEDAYREASDNLRRGSYSRAIELYRELLDQHPFSPHSEDAELQIARAHYLDGSCPEAVAAFTDMQRRYPTSPHLAMAGYLIGRCYEKDMRPSDRDQSASENAHAFFLSVVQQYPDSPYADLAQQEVQRCRERIAEHEMAVAEFYRGRGNDKAAEYRYLDLVHRFGDSDAAAEALYALGNLYRNQDDRDRALLAYAAVLRHQAEGPAAESARTALAEVGNPEEIPAGDPVPVLRAQAGRTRTLALTEVLEVPPLERRAPAARGAAPPGLDPGGAFPGAGGSLGRGY